MENRFRLFKIILFCAQLHLVTSCAPAIFTGATASTLEFAKDRSAGETISDIKIETRIKTTLLAKHFKQLYTRVNVKVMQGRVLLTGVIPQKEYAIQVIEIAWNQPGVTEVINELQVDTKANNFNLVQYTRDAMITTQIKSQLMVSKKDIKFINYTIITINDIVYIFGIARSEEELEKVANISANINGVQKVISHAKVQIPAQKIMPNNAHKKDQIIEDDLLIDGDITSDDKQDIINDDIINDSEIMEELDNDL